MVVWPAGCVRHLRAFEFDRFLLLERQTASKELAKRSCVQNPSAAGYIPYIPYIYALAGGSEYNLINTNNFRGPQAIENPYEDVIKSFMQFSAFPLYTEQINRLGNFGSRRAPINLCTLLLSHFRVSLVIKST